MNYIIYKAENLFNGEVYIGATTESLEKRRKDHLNRANREENSKFHIAINIYGSWVFSWKQIDTAKSINELAQKERNYIVEYDSVNEGYNCDSGGGFKKTVYQYDITDGSLVNSFDCLESAANAVSAVNKQLSRACLSVNKMFGGYYWSYEYKESFEPSNDVRKKKVLCYNLKIGDKLEFSSISEASKKTGVNKSSIAKVCRGERNQAGGYKWSFK